MIKIFIPVALLVSTILTCKKTGPTPFSGYYISFMQGDTSLVYIAHIVAHSDTASNATLMGVVASNADSTKFMEIGLNTTSGIRTGITYTDTSHVNYAHFRLQNNIGEAYYATEYTFRPDVKVNFTEITDTTVKGTFSGNMGATPNLPAIPVTLGAFYVPIR